MTIEQAQALKTGTVLTYDDGRNNHCGIKATVLSVSANYLIAQFEDRADTTKVYFVPDWLTYLEVL